MNILIISNASNDEILEDIWIARAFIEDGHKVIVASIDYDERLDDIVDIIIKRNSWCNNSSDLKNYYKTALEVKKRIIAKDSPRINFDGKFDGTDKSYLVKLFKEGYTVIPSIDNINEINLLPDSNLYFLKPKESHDGMGTKKVNKDNLKDEFNNHYIIQPIIKFKSEVQFYFIKDEFQYALEFIPSKVPIYPLAIKYQYSDKELNLAKEFAKLNNNYYGIQRIDFLKLENNELLLTEIEDIAPYLDLDRLSKIERDKFINNYKNMVYEYLDKRK